MDERVVLSMRRVRQVQFGVALVAALSALLVRATVYQTTGEMGGDIFNPASLGRCIYQAVMLINGGRADVSVVACEGGMGAIRAAFKAEGPSGSERFSPDESIGAGQATRNGQTLRVVALKPSASSPVLLVSVAQSAGDLKASNSGEVRHQIDEVPVPSGARVLSFMKNTDTRTALERLEIPMPVEGVRGYYDALMARNGWSRLFPASRESGLQVYVKDADVCCVGIQAADSYGESSVTLIHKRGAVE